MTSKNTELLKSYFYRLLKGESLETVKVDLTKAFESLDPKDIFKTEELIIIDGVPIEDVIKISDCYPELFSGLLKGVQGREKNGFPKGHPFTIMKNENEFLKEAFQVARDKLKESDEGGVKEILKHLKGVAAHYTKKSDLFYPLLKKDYRYLSPSSIMWGADDEIRDGLRDVGKMKEDLIKIKEKLLQVIKNGEGMIFKEQYLLAPICVKELTEIDWMRIYYELDAYEYLLANRYPIWDEAEERREDLKTIGGEIAYEVDETEIKIKPTDYVTIGSGMMTPQQLDAVFKTIPMEFTFVDERNINRYFDKEGNKIFKRPDMAIGRDMFSCHPPKLLPTVRDIILDFRTGKRDSVRVWMNINDEPVSVLYLAVRDEDGKYLGTLECVQKLGFAFERFEKMKK